jgi:DUF4097 and DUF4098 domain-containing protein YvlB
MNFDDEGPRSLTVGLPKGLAHLIIYTVSGKIDLNQGQRNFNQIEINTVSGDIKLQAGNVKKLQLNDVSGQFLFNGMTQNVDAHSVSGDLKFILQNAEPNLSISSTSGDVALEFLAKPNVNISYDSVSGDLKGTKDTKLGAGLGQIRVSTVSGDLRIKPNAL